MKKRKKEKGEQLLVVLFFFVSLIAFVLALQLFQKDTSLSSMGAFPLATASIMLMMNCVMLIEMRKLDPAFEKEESIGKKIQETVVDLFPDRTSLVLLFTIIYAILLPKIGFVIATVIFLWGCMLMLYKGKHAIRTGLISAGMVAVILFIFQFIFKVALP